MKSRARVGATLVAVAATATAALLASAPAQAAPGATQAPTRTTLSASPSTIAFGAPAKLKAIVKPVVGSGKPTGTVTFSEGGTVLGTVSLALVEQRRDGQARREQARHGDHTTRRPTTARPPSPPARRCRSPSRSGGRVGHLRVASAGGMGRGRKSMGLKGTVKAKVAGTGTPAGDVTFTEGATVLGRHRSSPAARRSPTWPGSSVDAVGGRPHIVATFVPTGGALADSTSLPKTVTITRSPTTVALDKLRQVLTVPGTSTS